MSLIIWKRFLPGAGVGVGLGDTPGVTSAVGVVLSLGTGDWEIGF